LTGRYSTMPNGTIDDLWKEVNKIKAHGCPRRDDDMTRIEAVEEWLKSVERKLDRIFLGTIGTLLAVAGYLLKVVVIDHIIP